jgi:hypothetical protein
MARTEGVDTVKRILVATLALILFSPAGAFAANVHLVGDLTVTDNGTTLTVSGKLAGLGNADVIITVDASGLAKVTCINPGGNEAPGINKKVDVTATTTIPASEVREKNGNVTFSLSTPSPAPPTPTEAGCPNDNWTVRIDDVIFTTVTLTVVQRKKVVLVETVTIP